MEGEVTEIFLPGFGDSFDDGTFPLKSYTSCLRWVFFDCSNLWRATLSWSIFFLLNGAVPLVSHFNFSCTHCDLNHQRPFNAIVQAFLSSFAALSFISLFSFGHRYGLRKFLFLDKLCYESEKVRQGYTLQIKRSMKLLAAFILPCFLVDSAYKIWWFSSEVTHIPYVYSMFWSKVVWCTLLMLSWLYRISLCFLVCILFRLTCCLQILRLEEFSELFEKKCDVDSILMEHLRIRRNLRVISHRFRRFILLSLILVTISQFVSLLVTTKPSSQLNIFGAGEVALCSVTLVTGLLICLRSAARITHRAQSITSLAAKWHALGTITSFDEENQIYSAPCDEEDSTETETDEADGDDEKTNLQPISMNAISYQKRQALVTYLEHNRAGITVYGFTLDRAWLHTIFALQLTLTLWILNKTIGIS